MLIIILPLNLVVLAALIMALMAGRIAPSVNTFYAVFGLVYPIILIINLLMLIILTIMKSHWVWVNLFVLLFGLNNMMGNFQYSANPTADPEGETIQVVSYNVQQFNKGGKAFDRLTVKSDILNFLTKEDASIVCLQEYQSENRNLYEPLKQIKDSLHAGTYYYESYYNPRFNSLSGLVIFSKYVAINKGKLKFEGSRAFGIYTDLLIGEDTVRVFNIHLANIRLVPEDIEFVMNREKEKKLGFREHLSDIYQKLSKAFVLREKQMAYLVELLQASPKNIILCGDFNDTPSSYVYHQLATYLNDCFTEKGTGTGRTYAGELPFLRIDYIMTSKQFETLSFERKTLRRSDHFPVTARLRPVPHPPV